MSIALLFPGQGAQQTGMGGALAARSAIAKECFDQASDVLGYDLLELCANGPDEKLNRTEFCQPALFVHSFAAHLQWREEQPDLAATAACVAGLSLGEYTAVAIAGGISFADGVRLVQARGRAMQAAAEACESAMASILGLDEEKLASLCEQAPTGEDSFVRVANLLCPGNIAISGHLDALARAEELCLEAGAMRAVRLQVAGAFHTAIMQPAVSILEDALAATEFQSTSLPVYSNVDAAPHVKADEFRQLLAKQVVSPVLWEASVRAILDRPVDQCVELGTGRVLAGTLKRIQRKFPCSNYGDE